MMTIDEAIKHAKEVASQKMAEYENYYDKDVHYYPMQCKKCAEEHKQLAEWLEELKELREGDRTLSLGEGNFITEDNLDKSIDDAYFKGYNKAIDDLTTNITERFFGMAMSSGLPTEGATWENAIRQVKEIAEQLKGVKQNDD